METIEILKAVNTLFDTPERWHKGCFAKTSSGATTAPEFTSACSWCMMGGCYKVVYDNTGTDGNDAYLLFRDALHPYIKGCANIESFNDRTNTTFEDIKQVLENAIQDLESPK